MNGNNYLSSLRIHGYRIKSSMRYFKNKINFKSTYKIFLSQIIHGTSIFPEKSLQRNLNNVFLPQGKVHNIVERNY